MTKASLLDLKAAIDYVSGSLTDWLLSALHPLRKARQLLAIEDEAARWKELFALWGVSFFISALVNITLFHPYGIELTSLSFHISCLLCFTFIVVSCSGAIQLSLRLYEIDASLCDIAAIYVSCFACYQPVTALLYYPSYLRFLSSLSKAKHGGLDIAQTVRLVLTPPHNDSQTALFVAIAATLCSCLLLALTCVSSSLMAAVISDRFSVSRLKSFSALTFATTVFVPLLLILQSFMVAFVEFSFL